MENGYLSLAAANIASRSFSETVHIYE